MKIQILALFFCFFVATHSAILPQGLSASKIAVDSKAQLKKLAGLREQAAACSKGKCNERNAPAKFKFSESLKAYVQEQYAKLKERPSKFETQSKAQSFAAQSRGDQKRAEAPQRKSSDDFFARIEKLKNEKPIKPTAELAKSLVRIPDQKVDNQNNARLLESMNNEYQEFDEGNIQANSGSKYTYLIRTDQFSQYNIIKVKTAGVTLSSNAILAISSNYYLKEILVSNQVLILVGYTGGYTLVFKYPLDSNGDVTFTNYAYFYKYGYPIASREKSNRALILTEQDMGTMNYDWYIGGSSIPFTTIPANSLAFTSGTYQTVARALWNIGMNNNLNDYYFEQFLFADWTNFINIGNTENFYILSQGWNFTGPTFNIQIVQDVVNSPYGASYPSGDYSGYVSRSFATDQYYSTFRVIATTFSPVDVLYYSFAVPNLAVGPPVSVAYGLSYPKAFLFVNEFAYIVFDNSIKVTTGNDAGTDYPQTVNIDSLHKYTANATVATNYLIGFGYNIASGSYRPAVVLYKISPAQPLVQLTSYQLSQNVAYFSSNYYWDHQSLLIDFNTKSIVFGVYNTGVSEPLVQGMYYLTVRLTPPPPCLFPIVCNPTSPLTAPIYKHWNAVTGVPSQFITAPSEMPTRFTIVQVATNAYLYSSSTCQMQARQLNVGPLPLNTVNRVDLCPWF